MSAQHTPGQLSLELVESDSGTIRHLCPVDKDGLSVLTVVEPEGVQFAAVYLDDDARRLVACWNACDGLRTESLERMGTLDRATIAHEVAAQSRIKLLEEQRDELLSAIGACRDAMPETAVQVNDAIADPLAVPDYVRESVSLLVAQRDELLAALKVVASIAHCGGLANLSESDALTRVRRATLSYLDLNASDRDHRAAIAKAGGEA